MTVSEELRISYHIEYYSINFHAYVILCDNGLGVFVMNACIVKGAKVTFSCGSCFTKIFLFFFIIFILIRFIISSLELAVLFSTVVVVLTVVNVKTFAKNEHLLSEVDSHCLSFDERNLDVKTCIPCSGVHADSFHNPCSGLRNYSKVCKCDKKAKKC